MEFKAGDRVHVLRYNGEDVDFYGTLKYVDKCMANLFDCTIKKNEGRAVFLPSNNSFGEDKEDYFVLEEDEEDTKGGNNLPTIKRKVEMNLPELIEWGFKNDIREKSFIVYECVEDQRHEVHFNALGIPKFSAFIKKSNTFTVEIEEQIDENTELTALVELSSRGLLGKTTLYRYHSINDVIDNQSVAFYILNDDQTMDLIWKNGKLVE